MSDSSPISSSSGYDLTPPDADTRQRMEADLSSEERHVLLAQGTERPFCGGLLAEKRAGTFACRLCGLPLFRSQAKFESGTGWPSFHTPFDRQHLRVLRDTSHGMMRTEIRCARCDSHLGHVFDDGPAPSGQRYCLNSVSLRFVPD
jgi:peptide-methionine (R)-S-oxide reductase